MTKLKVLHNIMQMSEYIKLEAQKDKTHHPLKNEMSKSSRRILFQLYTNGEMNQRTMSKLVLLSPQAISEAVKKLECDQILTKEITKNETVLKLTEQGLKEAEKLKKRIEYHAEDLFKDFSENELETFFYLTQKLMKKENN